MDEGEFIYEINNTSIVNYQDKDLIFSKQA